MARNQMPMMRTGGGVLGKLVGAVVTIAILAFVVKHPSDAAQWVSGAANLLGNVVDGLAAFLSHLHG